MTEAWSGASRAERSFGVDCPEGCTYGHSRCSTSRDCCRRWFLAYPRRKEVRGKSSKNADPNFYVAHPDAVPRLTLLFVQLYTYGVATIPKGAKKPLREGLTLLLNRMLRGDPVAGEQAAALVYTELHRLASREMRRELPGHTLQPTALVNETYLWFVSKGSLEIQNRGHFFALASQQMRRILVDHARSARAQKRGGGAIKVEFGEVPPGAEPQRLEDVLLLHEALTELERTDPRAGQVVELRYFGGYTDHEVVEALGVSLATVRRDWEFARSWLFDRLHGR